MKTLSQNNYSSALDTIRNLKKKYGATWNSISSENAARMITQNRFKTGLDIAKYTANIIAVIGTVKIYALARLGPSSTEAKK